MRSLRIIEIEYDSSNQIFSRSVYDRSNVVHGGLDIHFIALPTSSLQQLIKTGVPCQDKFIHAQRGSGWDDRLCPAHKHLAPNGSDLKRAHHQETKECYGNTHQVQRHCPSISINVHARFAHLLAIDRLRPIVQQYPRPVGYLFNLAIRRNPDR